MIENQKFIANLADSHCILRCASSGELHAVHLLHLLVHWEMLLFGKDCVVRFQIVLLQETLITRCSDVEQRVAHTEQQTFPGEKNRRQRTLEFRTRHPSLMTVNIPHVLIHIASTVQVCKLQQLQLVRDFPELEACVECVLWYTVPEVHLNILALRFQRIYSP